MPRVTLNLEPEDPVHEIRVLEPTSDTYPDGTVIYATRSSHVVLPPGAFVDVGLGERCEVFVYEHPVAAMPLFDEPTGR